ncbi:CinA family protein [Pelagibacterium montanilacus]|uniref:CinA family protein n=1 Tax=Pelagibacterium montanilacus TaxID=2185280 RepID=UPI000F8D335C|nr:CinA family protein [Pelagibacterium montanilacus]
MNAPRDIAEIARNLVLLATERGVTLASAESCTGGLISGAITAVPGSSVPFFGAYVTYDNRAKIAMIGVEESLIEVHGAVSAPVARMMAEGARATAQVDYAVAVTGIAGPSGGSEDKPIGLVHFAVAGPVGTEHAEQRFGDIGRDAVREETVRFALEMLIGAIQP